MSASNSLCYKIIVKRVERDRKWDGGKEWGGTSLTVEGGKGKERDGEIGRQEMEGGGRERTTAEGRESTYVNRGDLWASLGCDKLQSRGERISTQGFLS